MSGLGQSAWHIARRSPGGGARAAAGGRAPPFSPGKSAAAGPHAHAGRAAGTLGPRLAGGGGQLGGGAEGGHRGGWGEGQVPWGSHSGQGPETLAIMFHTTIALSMNANN